tara:strand:+ start:282 stop:1214 length:933 start_codon:yes stop_codon:yes gene_type:complete
MCSSDYKEITSLVGSFYDLYPFPPEDELEADLCLSDWRYSLKEVYCFFEDVIGPCNHKTERVRILDAGCGTGLSTNLLARLNPGSEILAIDVSEISLSIARKRRLKSKASKASEISFKNISLFDLSLDRDFDYINTIGLINHIQYPLDAFYKFRELLKPGGILHVFAYSQNGRCQINLLSESFGDLGLKSTAKDIVLARELIENLPKDNFLRIDYQRRCKEGILSDSRFADMYLHPLESSFNLDKLFGFIDEVNLEWIGFSDRENWRLERLIAGEMLRKATNLPLRKRLRLIESLDQGINYFDFFLQKPY